MKPSNYITNYDPRSVSSPPESDALRRFNLNLNQINQASEGEQEMMGEYDKSEQKGKYADKGKVDEE